MDDVRDRSVDDDTFPVVEDDIVPAAGDDTPPAWRRLVVYLSVPAALGIAYFLIHTAILHSGTQPHTVMEVLGIFLVLVVGIFAALIIGKPASPVGKSPAMDDIVPAAGDATVSAVVDGPYPARRRSVAYWSLAAVLVMSYVLLRTSTWQGGAQLHTSMGITLFPLDDKDPDQLLKNADMALYQAKAEGRSRYRFYNAKMNARAQARKTLENEMRRALERHEFCLHFQPKINTFTGDLTGVEALIRWQHPERGMVLPGEFIPVAETTGLIVPLGEWVLHAACAQSAAWQEMGLPPFPVAVNVSAIQFKGTDFIDTVTRAIDESGIDPACLELELTESTVMDETEVMSALLHRLRDLRLNVAIDDFGTGYSSFLRLKKLPVNKLKIDLSFVRNVTDDPANAAITKTIIALAKNLDLGVIAEGVETAEQFAFLRHHECDEVQGYYISRPLSGDQFTVWYGERLQNLAREG